MSAIDTASHIHRDAGGRAWIDDTNVKVVEVVLDHIAYGWSADEIHVQHPHLSLGQIHAALAAEINKLISNGLRPFCSSSLRCSKPRVSDRKTST